MPGRSHHRTPREPSGEDAGSHATRSLVASKQMAAAAISSSVTSSLLIWPPVLQPRICAAGNIARSS
jgi:hypothetical protein